MNISGATLLAEYRRAKADWPFIELVEKAHGLSAIAATHHTTVAALVARNGIKDPNRIAVGQVLRLP